MKKGNKWEKLSSYLIYKDTLQAGAVLSTDGPDAEICGESVL